VINCGVLVPPPHRHPNAETSERVEGITFQSEACDAHHCIRNWRRPLGAELRREREVRYRVNIGNGQQMLIVVFRPTLRRSGNSYGPPVRASVRNRHVRQIGREGRVGSHTYHPKRDLAAQNAFKKAVFLTRLSDHADLEYGKLPSLPPSAGAQVRSARHLAGSRRRAQPPLR
jgi:hypothetical protein